MAEPRFDLGFSGRLAPEADAAAARRHLMTVFKLDEAGVAQLFTGRAVIVRRDVDAGQAEQYRQVFAQAGAILDLIPIAAPPPADPDPPAAPPPADPDPPAAPPPPAVAAAESALALGPPTDQLEPPVQAAPLPDTGGLDLVAGNGWSLADCAPAVAPIPIPDLSHLTLADDDPAIRDQQTDDPYERD